MRSSVLLAAATVLVASGCGRRATEGDCKLIVNKSFELQLTESGEDAETVRKREAEVRTELDDKIAECESRRVTEKTMACVRAASTMAEMDKCLR